MWIRTPNKDRLIDCNVFEIQDKIDTNKFEEKYTEAFNDEAIYNGAEMPYVYYAVEDNGVTKKIKLYKEDFIKMAWQKHKENFKTYNLIGGNYILGTYATKERCLEVLDEIQQAIVESNIKRYEYVNSESNKIEYTYNNISVYEMPEV